MRELRELRERAGGTAASRATFVLPIFLVAVAALAGATIGNPAGLAAVVTGCVVIGVAAILGPRALAAGRRRRGTELG